MGPVLRIAGTWVVTTALVVLGVNAAIERVARDVDVARPAPMTPEEVDEQLRGQRDRSQAPTSTVPPTTIASTIGSPAPTSTGEPTTRPGSGPPTPTDTPTSEPSGPESTSPETPGGPPPDTGTPITVQGDGSGRPDERVPTTRP